MKKAAWFPIFLAFILSCEQAPLDMVLIPEGEFNLGIEPGKDLAQFMSEQTAGLNAQPLQKFHVDAFYIDRNEVTYEQFMRFKTQADYKNAQPREPVRGVNWYEADAYCLWAGKRLPTEFEWEKSGRGNDRRLFVWGNEFRADSANFGKKVRPVGSTEKDVSIFGVHDLNGNVSEWTASWYLSYPNSTYRDENFGKKFKVIRGGSIQKREHGFMKEFAMITYRNSVPPDKRFWDTGFRCARSG